MITLQMSSNGGLEIKLEDQSPSVYLDHWAFRKISENPQLRAAFVATLKEKGGTLCISWLNFNEFADVDISQKKMAEAFVDEVLPNIVFLESAPFVVIDRENELLNGSRPLPPHIDGEFGKSLLIGASKSVKPFSADRLFQFTASSELVPGRESLARTIIDRVEKIRTEVAADKELEKRVNNFKHRDVVQRGTRHLIREMLRSLLKNPKLKMTVNHAFDLMHTVVPVSYCDFVLIDSHWSTQVEQTRKKMEKDGVLKFSLAKVYSEKNDGINRFIEDLKTFEVAPADIRKAV